MKSTLLVLVSFIYAYTGSGQLVIAAGAQFSLAGNTHLTLQNTDLVNNGIFTPGSSMITFLGNATSTISGSQPSRFFELETNKTNNSSVKLQRSIDVTQRILLTSGFVDLNGFDTDLGNTGHIDGEQNNTRIVGPNGGEVLFNTNLNAPSGANPANLGIVITSNQNLGNVIIKRGHRSQAISPGGLTSILRYYDIVPTNNINLDATLQFKYIDGELNGLDENALAFFQRDSTNWTNLGSSSRDAAVNFVERTGISPFSRFTLSALATPLPVRFILLNSKCEDGKVVIAWKTAQEYNSSHFNVERSTDGVRWIVIDNLAAAGNSTIEKKYTITDKAVGQHAYYRIAQYDLNGRVEYTSVFGTSCNVTDVFKLRPNPTRDKFFIDIATGSESQALIRLFDNNGALMKVQKTTILPGNNQVSVDISLLANGLYQLHVSWNNGRSQKTMQVLKH